jgi:N-methylhydantoinase A
MPELFISLSHEVYPRWRENDRGHTTIADAYLKPMFSGYVDNLEQGLKDAGSPARLLMMKSNGGVVEAEAAALQPANFLVSGPVGGVLGGAHFAQLAGIDDLMTLDIGGTSCDVSLVSQQELGRAASFEIELGMPVGAPMVDIRAIGAGGGSIAWIDPGGLLRVGPQSAASDPGPACYSQGGTDATLTDANLVLGRLNTANFCGGDIPLDEQLARSAVKVLAHELGEPLEQTAHSIIDLANHNMVDALNVISVERGIDPRDYALVAFGGAGALHAVAIAQIIGITTVLIPPYPGNTSTFGLLTANLRSDLSTTLLIRSDEQEAMSRLNAALVPLSQRTIEALRRDGYTGEPEIEQKLEMRYLGQNYHRDIVIAPEAPLDSTAFDDAIERFHDDYAAFYGYSQRDDVVEVVGLVVTAIGSRSGRTVELKPHASDADAARRAVYFRENGSTVTRVAQREGLTVGELVEGPAIIEESLSTTVVPPGARLRVHESGSLLIETMSGVS